MLTPPAPYHLRALQLTDLETVREIETLSMPIPAKTGTYHYELTQNRLAHYQALTIKENGRSAPTVIGYAGYWMLADEAHVSIVAVHPRWRRRNLGKLLMLNLLTLACQHPATACTLEVRHSNQVAQSLYTRLGFAQVGRRLRYYRDGEDALIMTLPLNDNYCATLPTQCQALFNHLKSAD